MVPAFTRRATVGFDRTLIARLWPRRPGVRLCRLRRRCCSSASPERTAVCMLADKEEIGSVGVSGMQSASLSTRSWRTCATARTCASKRRCFEQSFCLSADVSNGV